MLRELRELVRHKGELYWLRCGPLPLHPLPLGREDHAVRMCRCSDGYNVEDVEELFARKDTRIAELEADERMSELVLEGQRKTIAALVAENERLKREAADLLDAAFQTVYPEEAEDIVAEAFPKGGPQWVLDWYSEHPTEDEVAVRERGTN